MKVFIEQPGEENKKNIFNKQSGAYEKTVDFHITYPYPYGYILDTKASDGDELDCYVITQTKLKTGGIYDCEPIGMVEYVEDGIEDNKILVVLKGGDEEVSSVVKEKLTYFDSHYFDNQPDKETNMGDFLGKDVALKEIANSQTNPSH